MTDVVDDYEGDSMFMSDAGKGGTRSESECYGRMRHWVLMQQVALSISEKHWRDCASASTNGGAL